jgi:hypothetical protein
MRWRTANNRRRRPPRALWLSPYQRHLLNACADAMLYGLGIIAGDGHYVLYVLGRVGYMISDDSPAVKET